VFEALFEGPVGVLSARVRVCFRTPRRSRGRVRIAWGGDVAGQGWGIDESRGGMRTFAAMRAAEPDLFIHSGDLVYADAPIPATLPLDDGTIWRNLVAEGVDRPAESLDEFRGRYRYNLRDAHVRAFNADVAMVAQWDDHEVLNNWYPGEVLPAADDGTGPWTRYREKRVDVLASRARQAFFDYTPIRRDRRDPRQVYRLVRRGRWPTSSSSTAGRTAGRIPPTASRQPGRRPPSSAGRRRRGWRRPWRARRPPGRSSRATSRSG
jgi:alkaline phosphatase D